MKNGFEWLRVFTPVLLSIALFIVTQIWSDVRTLSQNVYEHQTNADMHMPRSEVLLVRHEIENLRREVIDAIKRTSEIRR